MVCIDRGSVYINIDIADLSVCNFSLKCLNNLRLGSIPIRAHRVSPIRIMKHYIALDEVSGLDRNR